jgi:hypothetical protein
MTTAQTPTLRAGTRVRFTSASVVVGTGVVVSQVGSYYGVKQELTGMIRFCLPFEIALLNGADEPDPVPASADSKE